MVDLIFLKLAKQLSEEHKVFLVLAGLSLMRRREVLTHCLLYLLFILADVTREIVELLVFITTELFHDESLLEVAIG